MKKIIVFVLFFILSAIVVAGQDSAAVFVKARVQKNAVLLRWAAATPLAWKQTNRSGFRVERYTVVRHKRILDIPEKKILGDSVIRHRPLEEWRKWIDNNDYAGIVAQALFGEDFQLTGEDAQGVARIINMAQELEQRFTFSLYAADQDFGVACMAGWGWRDTTVRPGEYYLYRVIPANAADSSRWGMGSVYTSVDEYKPLPQPIGLSALWKDKSVVLMWEYQRLADVYNSYYIEKSTDGVTFFRLPGPPVSNLNNSGEKEARRLIYIDSLPDNTTTCYYRVIGINAFGETGPASEFVSGKGQAELSYVPVIRKAVINEQGALEMEWEFNREGNPLISGFQLQRAETPNGTYITLLDHLLPEERKLTYKNLEESNYLVIKAVALKGKSTVSYPVLIQPLDTLPPAVPRGITGQADTSGLVNLHWEANTEKDLLGYFVYRANRPGEEPVRLFDKARAAASFTDTVSIKTLNAWVYYYVVAVDRRYNQSAFSEVLKLRKPDVIPPLSPLISDYRVDARGIRIVWIPSPDEDVRYHILYRQQKGKDMVPQVMARMENRKITSWQDTAYQPGEQYTYTLFAEDDSGLISPPAPALTVTAPAIRQKGRIIERFDAVVDKEHLLIKLTWTANLKQVRNYEIYRREGEQPMSIWKILPGWQTEVMDENIGIGLSYSYMLRALFVEGGNSEVKKLDVKLSAVKTGK